MWIGCTRPSGNRLSVSSVLPSGLIVIAITDGNRDSVQSRVISKPQSLAKNRQQSRVCQPVADECPYEWPPAFGSGVCELYEPEPLERIGEAELSERGWSPPAVACRFLSTCDGTVSTRGRCSLGDAGVRTKLLRDRSA